MCKICFFFFFSSRRRHTRLTCDWSSDVCSSDLLDRGVIVRGGDGGEGAPRAGRIPQAPGWSRARKRIGALQRYRTPRRHDAKQGPGAEREEVATAHL